MTRVKDVIKVLENLAPLALQENYDNSGLIVGTGSTEVSGILVSLDCTEAIVREAISKNVNLIISHHPIVFSGIKRFNESDYVQRTVALAIKNDINLYAIHTNLDNILHQGVNGFLAKKLGLSGIQSLSPQKNHLLKLYTSVPQCSIDTVRNALFEAGAGRIGNYDHCSFNVAGLGTFRGNNDSNPSVGLKGEMHSENEVKLEVILRNYQKDFVLNALFDTHPYEEVAYELIKLENTDQEIGAGAIGFLDQPMGAENFLNYLKDRLNLEVIKFTPFEKSIHKLAICGGSGSFLRHHASQLKADAFITGDFKYHEFFDAESKMMYCDIGHYESEKHVIELLLDILKRKFTTFAVLKTQQDTNPIKYYF